MPEIATSKLAPIKKGIISGNNSNIYSSTEEADEVDLIINDTSCVNEEIVEKLQSLIAVKQVKLKTLTQGAAQRKCVNNIERANQYLKILKGEVILNEDDKVSMDVFDMIYYNCKQVALKISNSCIITGDAGMGKTIEALAAISFLKPDIIEKEEKEEIAQEENKDEETENFNQNDLVLEKPALSKKPPKKHNEDKIINTSSNNSLESGYFVAKGNCTAAYLYELLWIHRKQLIVFDDMDEVFTDEDALNLLKSATDTYNIREISKFTKGNSFDSLGMTDQEMWDEYEARGRTKVPNQFRFTGGIIIITNIHEDKFNDALISRSLHVEVRLTREEVIARMHKKKYDIRKNVPIDQKLEALEYLEFLTGNFMCKFSLNLREFIHAIDFRTAHGDQMIEIGGKKFYLWKQLLKGRIIKSIKKY